MRLIRNANLTPDMETMKGRTLENFGRRLADLRKTRGLTQIDLGREVGVSNRVIAYYEEDGAQPPGPMLVDLAKALRISVDQLLGVKPLKEKTSPRTARLLNRLRRVEELSLADQRALLRYLDALLLRNGVVSKGQRAVGNR
jgi:transcriptional regulator with XRE-family HTH domain